MSLVGCWWRVVIVGLAATMGWADIAAAQQLTLTWDPSPDPSVTGYIVYTGTRSGEYSASFNVGTATSFVHEAIPDQTYFFAVASYAAGMPVGPPSAEVSGAAAAVPVPPDVSAPAEPASADVTAPVITITQPSESNRFVVVDANIVLGGVAVDDHRVAAVKWNSSRGAAGVATGTDFWIAGIPLLRGRNDITVIAIDDAGNSAAAFVSVHRQSSSP